MTAAQRYRKHLYGFAPKTDGKTVGRTGRRRAEFHRLSPRQRRRHIQLALFYAMCDVAGTDGAMVNACYLSGIVRPPRELRPLVKLYFKTVRDPRSYAQTVIARIDPYIDAAGVEGAMRMQYGTLSHLSEAEFRREIGVARDCERAEQGYLPGMAESYGCYPRFPEVHKA